MTPVAGDLTVPAGVTLTLSPGATLQFASTDIMACGVDTTRAELTVDGTLSSTGMSGQHVALTATASSAGTWYGLVLAPIAVSSSLEYTDIDKAAYGLLYQATDSSNTIANDTVSTSTYGVYVAAGTPAMDSMLVQTSTYGFYVVSAAGLTLTNSIIQQCGSYGVYITSSSGSPTIDVMNCTLYSDGTVALYCAGSTATVNVQNSILTGSSYGIYRTSGAVNLTYSDVWGNATANLTNVTAGTGCLSQNPNYVSTTNLQLQSSSVCIDSGSGTGAPNHDYLGVTRPQDGLGLGSPKWDMGAYELVKTPSCGDGFVESGEQCDDGAANGTAGDCCSSTCTFKASTSVCRPASGQCDVAESCTGSGAACPTDAKASDASSCNDGNACTQSDHCMSGACVGTTVTCTALDECHTAGTCNTTSGCSTPIKPDGTGCSIGACKSGVCTAPVCGNGVVESPEQCDDGSSANGTAGDCCSSTCSFKPNTTVCRAASGQCDLTEYCTGNAAACPADVPAADNAPCDDGNACTLSDKCQSGSCVGSSPVVCSALDECHSAGSCGAGTGVCSQPNKPDGTSCSLGTCLGGTCTAPAPEAGTDSGSGTDSGGGTDAGAGTDSSAVAEGGEDATTGDGSPSTDGGSTEATAADGALVADAAEAASSEDSGMLADATPPDGSAASSDSGLTGDSPAGELDGASGDATAGGMGSSGEHSGCGCRTAGATSSGGSAAIPLLGLALLMVRRRRRA